MCVKIYHNYNGQKSTYHRRVTTLENWLVARLCEGERKRPFDPKSKMRCSIYIWAAKRRTPLPPAVYLWKWESDKEFHLHLVLFIKGTCLFRNSFTLSNSRRTTFMWFFFFIFSFGFVHCAKSILNHFLFLLVCFVCVILVRIYDFVFVIQWAIRHWLIKSFQQKKNFSC